MYYHGINLKGINAWEIPAATAMIDENLAKIIDTVDKDTQQTSKHIDIDDFNRRYCGEYNDFDTYIEQMTEKAETEFEKFIEDQKTLLNEEDAQKLDWASFNADKYRDQLCNKVAVVEVDELTEDHAVFIFLKPNINN